MTEWALVPNPGPDLMPRPVRTEGARDWDPDGDWQLLLAGDDGLAGVEALFRRHRHFVYRLACGVLTDRSLAEDATQEVFLRMARGRRRWRPRARFRTWLYRLTLNTCRELGRRAGRGRREASIPEGFDRAVEPVGGESMGELLPDLARALARLSRRQREIVVLRHLEGLSTRETAAVLGCREGTVKVHLHRALRALKDGFGVAASPPTESSR